MSAPHREKIPPVTQTASSGNGPGNLSAIPAGDLKIPDPIVLPTKTAIALQSPNWRGSVETRNVVGGAASKGGEDIHAMLQSGVQSRTGAPCYFSHIMSPVLLDVIFWISVACCAVAQVFILRAVFSVAVRPRSDTADATAHDTPSTVPMPKRTLEIAWAVLPSILLAAAFVAAWRQMHSSS